MFQLSAAAHKGRQLLAVSARRRAGVGEAVHTPDRLEECVAAWFATCTAEALPPAPGVARSGGAGFKPVCLASMSRALQPNECVSKGLEGTCNGCVVSVPPAAWELELRLGLRATASTPRTGPPRQPPSSPQCCCFDGGAGIVTYRPTDTCQCDRVVQTSQIWATVVLR